MRPGGGTSRMTDSDSTDLPQPDLADDAEGAAARDREIDAHPPRQLRRPGAKGGAQAFDRKQRLGHARQSVPCPSSAAGSLPQAKSH